MQPMLTTLKYTFCTHLSTQLKTTLWSAGSFDKEASIPKDKSSWLKAWDITDKKIQDQMKLAIDKDDGIVGTYYKRYDFLFFPLHVHGTVHPITLHVTQLHE
jgi:hypothetical protein